MKEKNEGDRRIQRTRRMLSDALFALIIESGYETLTVQDITERANIGRATFYLHYHDKEKLLEDSLLHLVDELAHYVEPDLNLAATYQTLSVRVFQHIAEQHKLYRALLRAGGPPSIIMYMNKSLAIIMQRRILQPLVASKVYTNPVDLALLAAHAAGSLLALVIWWLDHDLTPSAEEMGNLFWRLVAPGIEHVLNFKS